MNPVILFQLETENIKITIEAFFEAGGGLVVEGYDIGKTVQEYWGDSDYEYAVRVPPPEVFKLYALLAVPENDQAGLLGRLHSQFNTNTCFSEFREFLDRNGIQSEGSSWA